MSGFGSWCFRDTPTRTHVTHPLPDNERGQCSQQPDGQRSHHTCRQPIVSSTFAQSAWSAVCTVSTWSADSTVR